MKTLFLILFSFPIFAQGWYYSAAISATNRVAGDSILFDYHSLTDGVVTTGEWADQISGRTFSVTGTPNKGPTGITLGVSDGFYNDIPDYILPTSFTLEVVVTLDTTALVGVRFLAGVNSVTRDLLLIFTGSRLQVCSGGNSSGGYFTSSLHNTETHITVSWDGTIDSVRFNGVPQSSTIPGGASGGDADYLIFGQYDAGGAHLPLGSILELYAINPKFFTDAEATQNYTWWTEQ